MAIDIRRSLLLRLFDDNSEIINNLEVAKAELARKQEQEAADSHSPTPGLDASGETNGSSALPGEDQNSTL
jgi:hypothetical protein